MTKKKKKGPGAPPKISPAVTEAICSYLREGNYIEPSAILAGVCKSTVYNWMKVGNEARRLVEQGHKLTDYQKQCIRFLDSVRKAEAEAEADSLRRLDEMSKTTWQIIAWRLERRHPERWGRRQAIEHSSPPDKPVRVQRIVMGGKIVEF